MMKTKTLILVSIIACSFTSSHSQILNRVLKRTTDRVARKAEDMIVEKAAEAISRAVMRQIEKKVDDALKEEYERQDSIAASKGEAPPYPNYESYLRSMNRAADVPPSYSFDLQLFVTVSNKGEDDQDMVYNFGTEDGVFAVETEDPKEGKSIFLLDTGRDLTVVYNEKDGKKTAHALPNMMKLAGNMAKSTKKEFEVNATGNTKNVAGYNTKEYEITWEDEKSIAYITEELNYSWPQTFGEMLKQFTSEQDLKEFEKIKGITLESTSFDKKGKPESSWVVKKVNTAITNLDNKAYTFEDYASSGEDDK